MNWVEKSAPTDRGPFMKKALAMLTENFGYIRWPIIIFSERVVSDSVVFQDGGEYPATFKLSPLSPEANDGEEITILNGQEIQKYLAKWLDEGDFKILAGVDNEGKTNTTDNVTIGVTARGLLVVQLMCALGQYMKENNIDASMTLGR